MAKAILFAFTCQNLHFFFFTSYFYQGIILYRMQIILTFLALTTAITWPHQDPKGWATLVSSCALRAA